MGVRVSPLAQMKKIVVIVGPTAVGKSDFAVNYAIENNGEIISADSRQVYKGLDIGTGKITRKEMRGISHYLLDIADPRERFSVDKFRKLGEEAIENILKKGKLPIISGGTGFYIDALVNNISYPDTEHNEELNSRNLEEIQNMLKELDINYFNQLNNSEKNNKKRLIRAIEIIGVKGIMPKIKDNPKYEVEWIGLKCPNEKLKERIHIRLLKRIKSGMIEEVEGLYKNGLSWERMEELGLEYRYISKYLRNLITKEEMLEQMEMEIWHYAKRQMVWWKRNKKIDWREIK